MIAFTIVGLALVGLSFSLWSRPSKLGFRAKEDRWQTLRGILFGLWTLALPVYFLWDWNTHPMPPVSEFAAFQYGNKVWSDVWTAIAVVLGVLFGVKKP